MNDMYKEVFKLDKKEKVLESIEKLERAREEYLKKADTTYRPIEKIKRWA